MLYSPFEHWTISQKVYFAVQVNKLIQAIGDRGKRKETLKDLLIQLDISANQVMEVILLDDYPGTKTKFFFRDIDLEDRVLILLVHINILLSEDSFQKSEFNLMISMFDEIFGRPNFYTTRSIEILFVEYPDIREQFESKMIKGKLPTASELAFSKENIVFLAIITLAIIGLISIFT